MVLGCSPNPGAIVTYTRIDSGLISAYNNNPRGFCLNPSRLTTDFDQILTMSLDFDSARIPNPHLTEEHLAWREALRRFIDAEIMPHADDWDEAG